MSTVKANGDSQRPPETAETAQERGGQPAPAPEAQAAELTATLAREREAFEARVRALTETLARSREESESRLREMAEASERERAAHAQRLAEYEARLGRSAEALSAAQAELAALTRRHAEAAGWVRREYEVRLGRYAEELARQEAALADARARLEKMAEALHWMQTSRSGRIAARLRHVFELKQEWRRFSRRVRGRLRLPPPPTVFRGFVDMPAEGASVSGVIEVSGWVFSSAAPVVLVEAFLDDFYLGRLKYGVERADVSAAYPEEAPLACGYRDRLVPLLGMTGARELTVRAYDGAGNVEHYARSVVLDESVAETAAAEPAPGEPEKTGAGAEPLDAGLRAALEAVFAEFSERAGDEPSVLDWGTGLERLPAAFPHLAVFSPPAAGGPNELPYLGETVDLVLLTPGDPAREAEARRVASAAVVKVWAERPAGGRGDEAQAGGPFRVEAEWKPAGGARAGEPAAPSASIIIPVHNKVSFTEGCLERLRETLPADFDGEIIVVDDASTDETPAVLAAHARRDGRIKVLRNERNLGFIGSCNRGAGAASGEVLVFLNNDTLPQPGWLPPLLRLLRERRDAGAVGGKLVYPDGTLQEAGGVIFSDGSGCNFGKHDPHPDAPLYSFVREVDYCSGALLATPRALFLEAGGFNAEFAPAYYEDTNYCFSLRERGYKVYYQPESVVVHFEGVTSGTDITSGVKRYQEVNREKFLARWAEALRRQPPPPERYDFNTLHDLSVRGAAEE